MLNEMKILTLSLFLALLTASCQGHARSCWDTRQDQIDRREILKEAQCMKPRSTAVRIPVPEGYDYVYPSAVVVPRCSGHMCKMADEECVATDTRVKRVKIEAFKLNGQEERTCQYVDVKEDLACGCSCEEKRCLTNEVFIRKMCRCECQPKLKEKCKERMEEKPGMYMWDPRTCTCPCNNVRQVCGNGEIWADEFCRCLQIMSNEITN